MCGEKLLVNIRVGFFLGSPPRVRGEENRDDRMAFSEVINTACAGRSDTPQGGISGLEDHPRVCGEKDMIRSTRKAG